MRLACRLTEARTQTHSHTVQYFTTATMVPRTRLIFKLYLHCLVRQWIKIMFRYMWHSCSQWPPGLRRGSAAARLLGLWVRIPPGAWMIVCCECCVLSGRGLCNGLVTRPDESYRLWCVVVCDLETLWMKRPWPTAGCCAKNQQTCDIAGLRKCV